MGKSTNSRTAGKPAKPYADFPLFPHATGRWAKKIRQRLHYFGKIADDPDGAAALERFNREWPYLKDGRAPPSVDLGAGCTVMALGNAFLTSKRNALHTGELSERAFADYHKTCEWLIANLGKHRRVDDLRPDDFATLRTIIAKGRGPVTIKNEVNRIRVVLKFAFDERLIDRPVHYGQSFDRPSAKTLRRARNEAGPRMFEQLELRRILDALDGKPITVEGHDSPVTLKADPAMKAMVLLAANCGFGNTDVATLPQSAVDLTSGWIVFPRPKTEISRRVPLWPETVAAMTAAMAVRHEPATPEFADRCFLTRTGRPWVRVQARESDEDGGKDAPPAPKVAVDPLSQRFKKLLTRIGIDGRRGFYAIRHVFETIGGESRDQVAVNGIMGHVDSSMAAVYRERISDERLRAVVNTVRSWLWPE